MKKHANAQSNIMMLELVIVIGFFAVISTFIMRMFLAANEAQSNADRLSRATVLAESSLECILGAESPEEAYRKLGLNKVTENGGEVYAAYYDEDWNTSLVSSEYTLKVYRTDETSEESPYVILSAYRLVVEEETDDGTEEIYTLSTKQYRRSSADE